MSARAARDTATRRRLRKAFIEEKVDRKFVERDPSTDYDYSKGVSCVTEAEDSGERRSSVRHRRCALGLRRDHVQGLHFTVLASVSEVDHQTDHQPNHEAKLGLPGQADYQ